MRTFKLAAVALAAMFATAVPGKAEAAYSFNFTQTTPTVADETSWFPGFSSVFTVGSFILDSEIVGKSYTITADNNAPPSMVNFSGLIDIFFATLDRGKALIGDLGRFTTPRDGSSGPYYTIGLTGVMGSVLPTGVIAYNDTESDTRLTFSANGMVSGTYNTDRGGPCGTSGACSFSGTLTALDLGGATGGGNGEPTPVPEPMSLALFGIGLAGMVAVRRRRKAMAA